jgi:epoxide hydrolase-like predicted phosphatase
MRAVRALSRRPTRPDDPTLAARPRSALLIDWGGVLTTSVAASFEAFSVAERLPADAVNRALREHVDARRLLIELECGRLSAAQFEPGMCAALGLAPDRAAGLMRRMLASVAVDPEMLSLVRAVRARGVRLALVSNSWTREDYDGDVLERDFDLVLLSAELGVRKPDPAIYQAALQALAVEPEECVFVDDLGGNLRYARQLGMATVRHEDAASTCLALEDLFGLTVVR